MKNLKLFISFQVIVITLFIGNIKLSATYSQELQDAYQFAYKNGITTMDSINKADMNGGLTRVAMAKMLSQYAINILGKTPDKSKTITFPDVSLKLDNDYNNGVTLAYQLGIMGVGIDEFRPFDSVTRAEFGTAMSRVLYGDKYNREGKNYYSKHLNALKNAGIMTKIDNPSQKEIRGYVMLMLMRSSSQNTDGYPSLHDELQQNENYSDMENNYGSFEITSLYKGSNSNSSTSEGSLNGDEIVIMNSWGQNLKLVFKVLGNIRKEQIEYIGFIFKGAVSCNDGGGTVQHTVNGKSVDIRLMPSCSDGIEITSIYSGEKINNGELIVDVGNDIARNYSIEWYIQYNNVESFGGTFGLDLVKVKKGDTIVNVKNNGYNGNLYEIPPYSSREINIYSNGSDDIDFVKGMSYFKSIMKDKYQSIGEFTIRHGEGKENAYLKELSFNYSGNIYLNQAIDDIKLCNGHTRKNGTACISIPIIYTIKDKNIINIKLKDKISASDFSIFAKFKDLMYVGNNRIMLSVNGPENFKIEMEDGSKPFYNKFSFNGLYTRTKGRNKYEYEKEFGKLPNVSNNSGESYNSSSSSNDTSDNSTNESNNPENNSNNSSNNENTNTQPDNTSPNNTTQNDENSNNSNDEHSNESNDSESSSNSTSNSNCIDIEVGDGNSYNFCIVKWKSNGSKYSVKVDNAKDLSLCTVGKGGQNYDFYDCEGDITLGSYGISQLRLSIRYNNKTYSKKVDYDLTNGVFIDN